MHKYSNVLKNTKYRLVDFVKKTIIDIIESPSLAFVCPSGKSKFRKQTPLPERRGAYLVVIIALDVTTKITNIRTTLNHSRRLKKYE